jgi:NAD(P)-dependent dehydrogenase (short-subunit alcohol dehydrogenase family)
MPQAPGPRSLIGAGLTGVDTPWRSFLPDHERQSQFAAVAGSVPAGRIASPDDVADAVAYLVGASLVTGPILPVDGGFTVA